jgi:hypothetical protein
MILVRKQQAVNIICGMITGGREKEKKKKKRAASSESGSEEKQDKRAKKKVKTYNRKHGGKGGNDYIPAPIAAPAPDGL